MVETEKLSKLIATLQHQWSNIFKKSSKSKDIFIINVDIKGHNWQSVYFSSYSLNQRLCVYIDKKR